MLEIVLISILIAVVTVLAVCFILLYKRFEIIYYESAETFMYLYVNDKKFRETISDFDNFVKMQENYCETYDNTSRTGFEKEENKGEKTSE